MTSKIKVDNINKVSDDSNIINKCGTTITLGASGDSIALASGASQTGFGRTGTVDWQTSIKTAASFTAANGEGYFVDTSSNAVTANLPAGSVGAIVSFKDYAQNFDTNALTVSANGSEKIEGQTFDLVLSAEGQGVTLVYGDATKGWQAVNSNDIVNLQKFVTATGGTITTVCTNFKVHTFTGPGTFCVSCAGSANGSNTVSYVVVAGGGGGGYERAGGGGAGGFREGKTPCTPYTSSPLNAPAGLSVVAQGYPITVGSGGAGRSSPGGPGTSGNNSIFSTITSAGGGGGGSHPVGPTHHLGLAGGSGGGVVTVNLPACTGGGAGNTPPTTPPQGNPAGATCTATGSNYYYASSGGGATAAGSQASGSVDSGTGGAGATTSINGTPTAYAGGGGGGANQAPGTQPGGAGGGGSGGKGSIAATAGTANTGGGGGGGPGDPAGPGASGGSGIVMIRYKFQ